VAGQGENHTVRLHHRPGDSGSDSAACSGYDIVAHYILLQSMVFFFTGMEKRPSPAELLRSLISHNNYSLRELDRFYRMLSKRCHPDATGSGTGDDFIELRKVYEEAAARILVAAQDMQGPPAAAQQRAGSPARPPQFDPLQLVRE